LFLKRNARVITAIPAATNQNGSPISGIFLRKNSHRFDDTAYATAVQAGLRNSSAFFASPPAL
jgi:hypothetical protein